MTGVIGAHTVDAARQNPNAVAGHVAQVNAYSVTTGLLCCVLLCAQLLPPLPQYLGLSPSMALGMTMASGIAILLVGANWAIQKINGRLTNWSISAAPLAAPVVLVCLVVIHGLIAAQMHEFDYARFSAALIPLVFLVGGGFAIGSVLRQARPGQVMMATWISFWTLMGVLALKLVGLQPRIAEFPKSTFPFTETSHFALALGPILLYRCVTAKSKGRTQWVLLSIAMALALKSGTLLIVAFIAAVITRRTLSFIAVGAVVLLVGLTVELKYFVQRAEISNNSSNLTALVYLEGWEMFGSAMEETRSWGLGFEQMGLDGTNVAAAAEIRRVSGGVSENVLDGGFDFAKLGSEFGIFGALLAVAFCIGSLRAVRRLRMRDFDFGLALPYCIIVGYSVDMFVRGTGYFTQSTLLFWGAVSSFGPLRGLFRCKGRVDGDVEVCLR